MSADRTIRPLTILPTDPFGDKIGGIKTFVLDSVRFAPDDFAPEIIGCSSDTTQRPLGRWQDIDVGGRPVRYLPVLATPDVHRRPTIPLSLQFTVATLLRREAHRFGGRILQFHNPGVPIGFLTARAPRILVVHLNVADIGLRKGESRWGLIPGLLHRFEDLTLPRMDRIFMVSREGVDFYRQRHPNVADRVSFLPTSVDQAMFRPLPAEQRADARRRLDARLGVAAEDHLVLFVGRLERQKDPLLLVEAFAAAQRAAGNLRLLIVGEGGLRRATASRAEQLGIADRICWLGFQPREQLPELMNAADVLFGTSAFEGMPISVLEAVATGLPVVFTRVGEVDAVVHDGLNGRLVEDRSPRPLAEALRWTLDRPRESYAEAAARAIAPYEPRRVFEPFYEAHRELSLRQRRA